MSQRRDRLRIAIASALDCYMVCTIYQTTTEAAVAITGCRDRRTERFLAGERVKEFQAFADAAAKALTKLQAAILLGDLRNPPSNHFEALGGNRKGQYSIRINRKNRVCFTWVPHASEPAETDALQVSGDADDVEIVIDYH
jgi:proteic killer suppression protein